MKVLLLQEAEQQEDLALVPLELSECRLPGVQRGEDLVRVERAVESREEGRGDPPCPYAVAVLGSGPDLCYPPEHATLAGRIAAHGCLATEFPPGTPPRPWHFPLRNRILAGIAAGVVVVQAEPRSGALVTARLALDENRQVMAVPGDVGDPRSRGPHDLLRQGAALVDGARDVLETLGWATPRSDRPEKLAVPVPAGDATTLLAALDGARPIEALRARLGWSVPRLQRVLSELELAGLLRRDPGGVVSRAGGRC